MGELHDLLLDFRLHRPQGGRPEVHLCKKVHNRLLWDAWCRLEGGEEELRARRVFRNGSPDGPLMMRNDEFSAYRTGSRSMSRARSDALSEEYPALADVLRWPLGAFNTHRISRSELLRWHDRYVQNAHPGWGRYAFPGDATSQDARRRPVVLQDVQGLYERGDIYGFLTLVCIFRLHHVDRLADRQWQSARQLIRALPGACRDDRVRPYADILIALTKDLLILLPDSSFPVQVDDEEVWRQIRSPIHEPCYDVRRIAASMGSYIPEPPPPWVPFTYGKCRRDQEPMLHSRGG